MKSIIIGSGFGGISAALRLRAKGHEVTLVEKQNDLGGRARMFKKNGFSFDAGPTVITAPYLIYELYHVLWHVGYIPSMFNIQYADCKISLGCWQKPRLLRPKQPRGRFCV